MSRHHYNAEFPAETDPLNARLGRDHLLALPQHPEIIFRQNTNWLARPPEDELEEAHRFEGLLTELQQHYGITVVPHQIFMAKEQKRFRPDPCLYVAARRVHGVAMADEATDQPHPEVTVDAYTDTLAKLTGYYVDKSQRVGHFVQDLDMRQMMRGKVLGDDIPKNYLVDLDVSMCQFDPNKPSSLALNLLRGRMYALANQALNGQAVYGNVFGEIRNQVGDAYERLLQSEIREADHQPSATTRQIHDMLSRIN